MVVRHSECWDALAGFTKYSSLPCNYAAPVICHWQTSPNFESNRRSRRRLVGRHGLPHCHCYNSIRHLPLWIPTLPCRAHSYCTPLFWRGVRRPGTLPLGMLRSVFDLHSRALLFRRRPSCFGAVCATYGLARCAPLAALTILLFYEAWHATLRRLTARHAAVNFRSALLSYRHRLVTGS